MPDINDYHAFKSTSGNSDNSGGSGGGGLGCGGFVIAVVVIMLIHFIANGASWDAIDGLLGWGLIAFFLVRFLFS